MIKVHKGFSMPEYELRETLVNAVRDRVFFEYYQFYSKLFDVNFTKKKQKYLKYDPREVEEKIRSLFEN